MKYSIGDKVKMKKGGCDFGHPSFLSKHNYVLTIKEYDGTLYLMYEDYMWYSESSIEGLYIGEKHTNYNRFEIMDI